MAWRWRVGLRQTSARVDHFGAAGWIRVGVAVAIGGWYLAVAGADGSRLHLKENILSAFKGYGVHLSGAVRADLDSNRITGSNSTGVQAVNARVQMRNDELTALGNAIVSAEGARIELSDCRISRCGFALWAHKGTIVATGNDLRGNDKPMVTGAGGTIEESDNQL